MFKSLREIQDVQVVTCVERFDQEVFYLSSCDYSIQKVGAIKVSLRGHTRVRPRDPCRLGTLV